MSFQLADSKSLLLPVPPLLLLLVGFRNRTSRWGLCADEFAATGHWPPQLYTRETRRLVGDRVFTQNTPSEQRCLGNVSIGVGDYTFDSHPAQRFACRSGADPSCAGAKPSWLRPGEVENRSFAWSEGNVQSLTAPYAIPFWVLVPRRAEVSNLLVVATPSGTHVGFSSLRMEPQFMVLGHSAGTAAAIFARNASAGKVLQDVDLATLAAALRLERQILAPPSCGPDSVNSEQRLGGPGTPGLAPRALYDA